MKMMMENSSRPIKCDFLGCPNLAKYSFKTKKLFHSEMNFCESCMKEMFEEFSKKVVPKSPEPPFKNPKKLGEKR